MTDPMPADFSERQRRQAELTDLRHVALCFLQEHGRATYPRKCECSTCRAAGRWIPHVDPNRKTHLPDSEKRR